ncbi:MAG: hypothetical protein A2X58_04985 [Nitrospirae bacterium GWC2_56_14]|nr:MAG: hypothetical protein A2X58_04985 [Nitrospirae bacterium GWC2_56_14]
MTELYACQSIKTYSDLCGLNCKLSMHLGKDPDHKLTAKMLCRDRLRQWFMVARHICDHVRYHCPDTL